MSRQDSGLDELGDNLQIAQDRLVEAGSLHVTVDVALDGSKTRLVVCAKLSDLEIWVAPPHLEEGLLLLVGTGVSAVGALTNGVQEGGLDVSDLAVVVDCVHRDLEQEDARRIVGEKRIEVWVGANVDEKVGFVNGEGALLAAQELRLLEGGKDRLHGLEVAVLGGEQLAFNQIITMRTTYE